MKTNSEYKQIALDGLKDKWGLSILITLIITVVFSVVTASMFGSVLVLILTGPIEVGIYVFFEKMIKKEEVKFETPFEKITDNFTQKMTTYLIKDLFIFLWSLLLVVPGIIKSYSYALSLYICSRDNNIGAEEAITLSRKVMQGNKLKLFYLQLSFIGWFLLCLLTFGVGFIFLSVYYKATETAFLKDLYDLYLQENPTKTEVKIEEGEQDYSFETKEIVIEE